jgi:5-methyltetrahydrofolate--homocysteine methyltransferase
MSYAYSRSGESTKETLLDKLSHAVVSRDCRAVKELTEMMLSERMDYRTVLNGGLIPGMREASERFRSGEFFIPELLMSSRALRIGLDILKPLWDGSGPALGKVVIGSVQFDLHDIGKDMCAIMLNGSGFDIIDLGVDVTPERFVRAVEKHEARILALSALLTTTMRSMKSTIELLHASGLGKTVKVMVGGAPVTSIFAKNVGADAYCREAVSAAATARQLLGLENDSF